MDNYAWFQESLNDTLVSVGGIVYNQTCSTIQGQFGFFLADDANNVTDLCKAFSSMSTAADRVATFKRANGSTYNLPSELWVGSRPPSR